MAPKRRVPPLKPNADGTGFTRASAGVSGPRSSHVSNRSTAQAPSKLSDFQSDGVRQATNQPLSMNTSDGDKSLTAAGDPDVTSTSSAKRMSSSADRSHRGNLGAVSRRGRHAQSRGESSFTDAPAAYSTKSTAGAADLLAAFPSAFTGEESVPEIHSQRDTKTKKSVLTSLALCVRIDPALEANVCLLHPSGCRELKVSSGAILQVQASRHVAFVEVNLCPTTASGCIVLGAETGALLEDSQVTAAVVDSTCGLPAVQDLIFDVEVEQPDGACISPDASAALRWQSLFRQSFHGRVVFSGMRAPLRLTTQLVTVDVSQLTTQLGEERRYGMLTSASRLHVGVPKDVSRLAQPDILPSAAEPTERASLAHHEESDEPAVEEASHALVVGESGTGKTLHLRKQAAADRSVGHRHVELLRVEELPQGEGSEVSTATVLREVFKRAKQSAPATVVVDDLQLLCPAAATSIASQWASLLLTETFCEELRLIEEQQCDVRVLASAPDTDMLDPSLLVASRFGGRVVRLSPPSTAAERVACLNNCLARGGVPEGEITSMQSTVERVAADAHGFTQRDLSRVVEAAFMEGFRKRRSTRVTAEDLMIAVAATHPSSLRQFEVTVPQVTWDDIGGSAEAKQTLQEVVEWCLGKQSWVFSEFKLTPPKGVLLYGPPGCSKTMLAKALANESHLNFISVKGPEVFSKWVGDSEKAVRDIFTRARAVAPCVVFIDELDGMCGHRGRGGVSDRVISQFLTELDGLPSAFANKSNALVFVAATNRPDSIDPAVLRPGRIDRRILVGLPTRAEREAIVRIQFNQIPTAADLTPAVVAERTEGYSGAEVVAVVKEAAFLAITADKEASCIILANVEAALSKVRPRTDPKDVEWYKKWPNTQASKAVA